MRILHVFDHSLPLQSGYVSRSIGIIQAQRARGWQTIHLTTPRYNRSRAATETVDGLIFHRTWAPHIELPILRELVEMRATKRALARLVRSERPDLVHAHSPVLNGIPALSVGRRFGLPVVYEVRALWEDAAVDLGRTEEGATRYRATRWLETQVMRRADRIAVLCDPLRDEILRRGIPADRITVVPNAVDAQFLASAVLQTTSPKAALGLAGRTVLGFIGSFYSYEGLDLLIGCMPALREKAPDILLLLVGGGPDEPRLRALVEAQGLGETVRFVGRVKHEEVPRYYAAVDILVYPRRRMRLTDLVTPLKPLEAMARSRPLVASDVGGHRELVRDGDTGYLFAADDAAALTQRLLSVIADPADRARVAANGRRFVERERTWEVIARRYATLYEAALGWSGAEGARLRPTAS